MKDHCAVAIIVLGAAFVFRASYFLLQSQLLAIVLCGLGLWGLWSTKKRGMPAASAVPVALSLAYWLAFPLAGDKSAAIVAAPVISGIALWPLVMVSVREDLLRKLAEGVATLVGVGSAATVVVGTMLAALKIRVPGLLESGRFSALVEYPNALAALLVVGALMCLGLIRANPGGRSLSLWTSLGLIGAGLMSTYSRLGIAIAILVGVVDAVRSLISLNRLPYDSVSIGFGMAIGLLLFPAFTGHSVPLTLVWLGAAASIGPFMTVVRGKTEKSVSSARMLTICLVATGALLLAVTREQGFRFAISRLSTLQMESSWERFAFLSDGLRMFLDRPVVGWGGGFFKFGSLQYRIVPYFTHHVHNHLVETALEAGILGAASIVAAAAYFLKGTISTWRASNIDKGITGTEMRWVASLGGLSLWVHSLGDFGLSIPAMALLFWYLFALQMPNGDKTRWHGITTAITTVLLVLGFVFASLNTAGFVFARNGADMARREGASLEAMRNFELGAIFAPFSSDYRIDLAQILMANGESTRQVGMAQRALSEGKAAVALSPLDPRVRAIHAVHLAKMGWVDEAIAQMETAVSNDKFGSGSFEILCRLYSEAAQVSVRSGNLAKAKAYGQQAYEIPHRMRTIRNANESLVRRYGVTQMEPRETDGVRLYSGIGAVYARQDSEAIHLLGRVSSQEFKNDASVWRAVIAGLNGDATYESQLKAMPTQLVTMVKQLVSMGRP